MTTLQAEEIVSQSPVYKRWAIDLSSSVHLHLVDPSGRILSVQSHVAFGYVGGKAAVFPLQCMGYDVDIINTVNYSNHTGYSHAGGTKTSGEEFSRIFDAMQQSGVLTPDRLLTGYIPNADCLRAVYELAKRLRTSNPNLIYLLDPVVGDSGSLYLTKDCIPVYRQMLPLANIITPNWFETEVLTEVSLTDLASLRAALRKFHSVYHVPNVVISSIPLSKLCTSVSSRLVPVMQPSSESKNEEYIVCIASSVNDPDNLEAESLSTVYVGCVEFVPGYFTGVGDLFAAFLLGHLDTPRGRTSTSCSASSNSLSPLAHAASHALSRTHAVLTLTHESASTLDLPPTDDELDAREPGRKSKRMKGRELRIIQGQDIFRRKEWDGVTRMTLWEGFWVT